MRIEAIFLWVLAFICAGYVSATETAKQEIKELQTVIRKIEAGTLQSQPLSDEWTLVEHALILRSLLSTIYSPLDLIFNLGLNAPLFSEAQSQTSELIQLARLTHVLPSKQECWDATLSYCQYNLYLQKTYLKFLHATPAFKEKKDFIMKHVYNSSVPAQQRLLIRAICYILFSSLDFVMLSPSLSDIMSVKVCQSFYDTSTANMYEFLRYSIEVVENIGQLKRHVNKISSLFREAIGIEERFYEQFLGDLLNDEQMKQFKSHLKTIVREIIKILSKEGFVLTSRSPLEYIRS